MPFVFDARRRRLLAAASIPFIARLARAGDARAVSAPESNATAKLPPLFDDLARRTFDWFWDMTPAGTGLTPDRAPSRPFCSIAAVGFGLTAYPIGVERGYVTRAQAVQRVLATLRFFRNAPQGPAAKGVTGYRGFFYHFLDFDSGTRWKDIELSTIDTALLLGGILFCSSYFDVDSPDEAEIRRLAHEIEARVDWAWMRPRAPAICHGWTPEGGFIKYDWRGYNEAMLLYVLALGAPASRIGPEAWREWTSTYGDFWRTIWGEEHLTFGPLFGHQYSHVWIDFRGIRDAFMRDKGIDYFENSRRATRAQRAYAIANPLGWQDYGENVWGLTACDGPTSAVLPYREGERRFRSYSARGVGRRIDDDGTIAPTAAAGSLPFAPEIVVPAIEEMHRRFGEHIYGRYGFLDSFNRSFEYDAKLTWGRRVPGFGWVDTDYLGIDQGPILAMMENHRTGLVWSVMRRNETIRRGLQRAGFSGSWIEDARNAA